MKAHAPSESRATRGGELARFMELRGRHVKQAAGVYWHSVGWRLYMSMPYQLSLDPDPGEIREMLRSVGGLGARFPSTCWPGLPSGLYVCRRKDYDFSAIQPRYRTKVRRGLERCIFRHVEPPELLAEGLELNRDTMRRQGRFDPEFSRSKPWERLVSAVFEVPAVEATGAYIDGRLSAYAITYREDGWLHILHQMSREEDLHHYPNHALTFHLTQRLALEPELEAVSLGQASLVRLPGLHAYKLRLGYELIPRSSAICLHPALAVVLASPPAARLARWLRPCDQRLERVSQVMEGARLSRQNWENTARPLVCTGGRLGVWESMSGGASTRGSA